MNWNTHEVEVGLAIGAIGGLALGYELRKLVVRFQEWRQAVAIVHRRKCEQKMERVASLESVERDKAYFEKRKKDLGIVPNVIPIRTKRSTPVTPVEVPIMSDRDDVIAALMGSGYSKTEAAKAADACSLAERCTGLEGWMRAAFTNATRKS